MQANWKQSKTFFGFIKVELLPGLFSFTFSLPPFFICSFFFLSFCLAFVRRVHFYGKGLGKTLRIIELPRLKIFIETFGSTLCQFSPACLTESYSFRLFLPAQVWHQSCLWLFQLMASWVVQSMWITEVVTGGSGSNGLILVIGLVLRDIFSISILFFM